MLKAFLPGVLLLTALLGSGCGDGYDQGDSPVIAQYKEKALTQEELNHYLPDGILPDDSARYAQQFIRQWLKEQAVCDKALTEDETLANRVEYKVRDYRAKLIMHEYHSRLISTQLDMEVSETAIRNYYEANKDNFKSKENLFAYFYLVTTEKDLDQVASWMRSKDTTDIARLRNWCASRTIEAKIDSSYSGETRINQISKGYFGNLSKASVGQLIRWSGVIQGNRRRYMFKMLNTVDAGEPLPLSMCADKIRGILLNERKIRLIEETEDKILENAEAQNYIR